MKNDKYLYAMKKRCSRRKYTNRLIEPRDVEQIILLRIIKNPDLI